MATLVSTNAFTASIWNKPRAFQDRTNLEVTPLAHTGPNLSSCPSVVDPQTSDRHLSIKSKNTPGPSIGVERRLRRYSTAEEELEAQFRQCNSEASPRELQIRALEQATAMLSAHAQESRGRAEELRAMLADRQIDPEVYETLKRERWMEEKRQTVFDQDSKVVLQHLENLVHARSPTAHLPIPPAPSQEQKIHANLVKFLELSPTRTLVRHRKSTTSYLERSPRRRTIDRVSSLRLRAFPISNPSFRRHFRSVSLNGHQERPIRDAPFHTTKASHTPTHAFHTPQSLNVVSEEPFLDSDTTSQSSSSISSCVYTPTELSSPTPLTTFTNETICTAHANPATSSATIPTPESENGTATIYLPESHNLSSINTADIYAPLPDYALDLFSQFERTNEIYFPIRSTSIPPSALAQGPSRSTEKPSHPPERKDNPRPNSMPPPSAFLKVPTPTMNQMSSQDPSPPPRLGHSRSHRHLGLGSALFAIPEALSSRLGVDSGGSAKSRSASFLEMAESDGGARIGEDDQARQAKGHRDLGARIRRRFSAIRLARS
ncbi:hypothetical protein Hypma_006340 [Hypsizygus marmoreus]|uniref:Uncharacterized protein n=1 Tax=Hypsizygus marmoreus TaxID=39966 RepID=A0A369JUL8_HYPMA|nr:hypothetical protein Hypma_006340 [Hypsizygus marmoreus]